MDGCARKGWWNQRFAGSIWSWVWFLLRTFLSFTRASARTLRAPLAGSRCHFAPFAFSFATTSSASSMSLPVLPSPPGACRSVLGCADALRDGFAFCGSAFAYGSFARSLTAPAPGPRKRFSGCDSRVPLEPSGSPLCGMNLRNALGICLGLADAIRRHEWGSPLGPRRSRFPGLLAHGR